MDRLSAVDETYVRNAVALGHIHLGHVAQVDVSQPRRLTVGLRYPSGGWDEPKHGGVVGYEPLGFGDAVVGEAGGGPEPGTPAGAGAAGRW